MGLLSPTVRLVLKAASVAILWLLTTSSAEGSPASRRVDSRPVCDAQSPNLRKLARRLKSFGGPVARTHKSRSALRIDLKSHLHRKVRIHVDDDSDAIQNDAAAAGTDPGDDAIPGLRALGIVIGSVHKQPGTPVFSPRSPRGPPASV